MPIQYKLGVISELLVKENFPQIDQIATIRKNLDEALGQYCGKLKDNGIVTSCDPPDSNDVLGDQSSCRLCDSCGGDFPELAAIGIHEDSWGPWKTHGPLCSSPYSDSNAEPHWCCQKKKDHHVPCKFCESCGNAWPFELGKKKKTNDYGPWYTSGDQCSSESLTKSYGEFSMCCQGTNSCRMCQDECGQGFIEVGQKFGERRGTWNAFEKDHCQIGEIRGFSSTSNRVVMCCPSPNN